MWNQTKKNRWNSSNGQFHWFLIGILWKWWWICQVWRFTQNVSRVYRHHHAGELHQFRILKNAVCAWAGWVRQSDQLCLRYFDIPWKVISGPKSTRACLLSAPLPSPGFKTRQSVTVPDFFFRYRYFISVPNFSDAGSCTFFGAIFFRYRFGYFFQYQIFSVPVPVHPKIPGWYQYQVGLF